MLMEDVQPNDVGTIVTQGIITNPVWSWTTVGAPLWVLTGGTLSETDPHVTNAGLYPESKPPVARVITATSVIFDQGLGGKGETGPAGASSAGTPASTSALGVAKISVTPAIPTSPIAVGTNDPRMSDARAPLTTLSRGALLRLPAAPPRPARCTSTAGRGRG